MWDEEHMSEEIIAADPFVYRIITEAEWQRVRGEATLPLSPIDEKDGYIHLSSHAQALESAALHFSECGPLALLEFESASFGAALRWEPVATRSGRFFPHLYLPALPRAAALAHISLTRESDGSFHFGERLPLQR